MQHYVLRHGETEWNVLGRMQGQGDSPLTALGREQATRNARLLRTLLAGRTPRVVASSLGRAVATAGLIADEIGLPRTAIRYAQALTEHDFGLWRGLTKAEVELRYPGELAKRARDRWHHTCPDGESYAALHTRVDRWWREEGQAFDVIITHEMVSRVLRGVMLGYAPDQTLALEHPHGSIFEIGDGTLIEHSSKPGEAYTRAD